MITVKDRSYYFDLPEHSGYPKEINLNSITIVAFTSGTGISNPSEIPEFVCGFSGVLAKIPKYC